MIKTQKAIEYFQNRSTNEITEEEWEFLREKGVCNGCGGKDCFISHFLASLIAPIFFTASCDKHDFGYWKGGDEARRKECDKKFLEAILRDVELTFGNTSTFHQGKVEQKSRLRHFARFGNSPRCDSNNQNHFVARRIKKVYFIFIAYLFYFSVRIGGKKYFNYRK